MAGGGTRCSRIGVVGGELALGLTVGRGLAVVAGVGATLRLPATARFGLAAVALCGAGLWWGGLRVHELDRSVLAARIGQPAGVRVVVTGAASRTPYAVRVAGGGQAFRRLVVARAGPAGATGRASASSGRGPRAPGAPGRPARARDRFRRARLARTTGDTRRAPRERSWRIVGRRGGIGGVGDRLRTAIGNALALGTTGERRSLVLGVVLGADEGIDPELRDDFKASGLYHLLAVSGQNIAFIGFGVLGLAYVAGLGRPVGHTLAIVAIVAYALAVGWQPSVARAAVAGCLGSLGWLLSRPSDRWHALAVGAVVLLAWTPRSLLEPGFQLSFAAVAAIFLSLPRLASLAGGLPRTSARRRRDRHLGGLWPRYGADPLAAVRHDSALDRAGERPRRAGDAGAAGLWARGGARRTGLSDCRGLALVARGSRGRLGRVCRPSGCVAPVRPDVVPDARPRARRRAWPPASRSGRCRATGGVGRRPPRSPWPRWRRSAGGPCIRLHPGRHRPA